MKSIFYFDVSPCQLSVYTYLVFFILTLFSVHVCNISNNPFFISSLSVGARLFWCWCGLILNPFWCLPLFIIFTMLTCSQRAQTWHFWVWCCLDSRLWLIITIWYSSFKECTEDIMYIYCICSVFYNIISWLQEPTEHNAAAAVSQGGFPSSLSHKAGRLWTILSKVLDDI